MKEVEGVGGGTGEGVLVQNLFGEGADQGLASELAVIAFFGALDDVVDMEGAFGGQEQVMNYIHIRLTIWLGGRGLGLFGAAQGAQGAELGKRSIFKDIDEVVFIERIHNGQKRMVMGHNV